VCHCEPIALKGPINKARRSRGHGPFGRDELGRKSDRKELKRNKVAPKCEALPKKGTVQIHMGKNEG